MMRPMKFRRELTYEATPHEVFAMIADPAFREKIAAAQGVVSVDVTCTPTGEGLTVVIDQEQDTAGLPAIAKKIVGETTQAVVTEEWTSRTSGSYDIVAPGKPTRATGTVSISAAGSGASYALELEVKVKVPLIAGKLEKVMADQINNGLDIEQRVGAAWLRGER